MREIVCIVCPNSCRMTVEESRDGMVVTGNRCGRGETFARSELTCPVRTFSTTVRTAWDDVPVVPVRVTKEVPKERIFDIMEIINQMTVRKKMGVGDVLIENVLGLDADVIVTDSVLEQFLSEEEKRREKYE